MLLSLSYYSPLSFTHSLFVCCCNLICILNACVNIDSILMMFMMMSLRLAKQLRMSEVEGGGRGMQQRLLQLPLTADKKQTQPKSDDENK